MISHLIRRLATRAKGIAASDDFNRPNGAMGSTPVGELVWEPVSGTWQIQSNKPYTSTSQNSNPIVAVDAQTADVDVTHDIASGGGDALYFRIVDATNWWRVRHRRYSQTTSYSCTQYCTQYEYKGTYVHNWSASHIGSWGSPDTGSSTVTQWGSSFPSQQFWNHAHFYASGGGIAGNHTHSYNLSSTTTTGATRQVACGTTTCYSTTYHYLTLLEKSVGGVVSSVREVPDVAATNLRVISLGSLIRWFINGVERTSATDAAHQGATKHGPGRATSELSVQGLDNFSLTPQE